MHHGILSYHRHMLSDIFQIDKYTLRKYSNPISSGDTEKSVNTSGKAPEVENLEMSNNK